MAIVKFTATQKDEPYASYVTPDGLWAAIPYGERYIIINNGQQVHLSNTLATAKNYIIKELRKRPK
jgi:hypothetical protein